ncbi:PREDICTED: glutathione S-transferase kappa 1 isoform X3 [Cyprinodon variegatus]|uniref:glutathione S-transferase kappa 1 isoform X3 n=1 Tax=Cyprinodon variegatus TaxID=28743 RepID=UPI000742AF0E|nr:PREDICTED: glutathione S-transferase kappa 1 isoform X3 [Cyprinodon variegatus]
MTSKKVVELFYDVVSPYSWLGFEVMCRYRNVWNIELKLRPAFLGGVMQGAGSLSAMRFVTAVQQIEKGGDKQVERVSRELWRRIWSEDKDITQPQSFSEAAKKAGLTDSKIEEALKLCTSQEIKDKLKHTTEEALNYGAFGFPMVICHIDGKPEMFFGSDRFELMANCMGEKWLGPTPNSSASKL